MPQRFEMLPSKQGWQASALVDGAGPFAVSTDFDERGDVLYIDSFRNSEADLRKLYSLCLADLAAFAAVTLDSSRRWRACDVSFEFDWYSVEGDGSDRHQRRLDSPSLDVVVRVEAAHWIYPYTIEEFVELLVAEAEAAGFISTSEVGDSSIRDRAYLGAHMNLCPSTPLAAIVDETWPVVLSLLEKVDADLHRRDPRNTLLRHFAFPIEVRAVCEQYLVYFAEFLRNAGIEAESSVSHRNGQTILSVIPKDGEEAMELVHAALTDYLKLADSSPVTEAAMSVVEMQMTAQIHHLQGQLTLAAAVNRANSAALDFKDAAIALLKAGAPVSPRQPAGTEGISLPNPNPNPEPQDVMGLVRLETFSGPGFKVHLGEVFRRLEAMQKTWKARRAGVVKQRYENPDE